MTKQPEILAPVGTWDMCRAAVHNGAHAVYIGAPFFNARGRTEDLSIDTLGEMISFCHLHGVKVFLALNVLIFERELPAVEELLTQLIPLGPDAFIVQDVGLARLIKKLSPSQVIHASTQMTVTCPEAIECTEDLGMSRYVLARELSVKEIQRVRDRTTKELEVFVHGALCVAYSGQCLTSESMGGRSANRGQCAQSCRWEYKLVVDGEEVDLGSKRHLVSPKDLCGLDDVPRLSQIGVDSFKIEGRLKSPEYVAQTVTAYRARAEELSLPKDINARLRIVYSRDFYNGWLDGVNHQRLVRGDYSNNQGLELGTVRQVTRRTVVIATSRKLSPGDGVGFLDFSSGRSAGSTVFRAVAKGRDSVEIEFGRDFHMASITPGMTAFLNSSPSLEKELRQSFTAREKLRTSPLSMVLSGKAGTPLCLTVTDTLGHSVSLATDALLETARNAPLSAEDARRELGALSGSPFHLAALKFSIEGDCFIHNRELKGLRQRATAELVARRSGPRSPVALIPLKDLEGWKREARAVALGNDTGSASPALTVLLRDIEQIQALEGLKCATVYLDFEFGKEYGPALSRLKELGFQTGIATTRILKPGELGHLQHICRLKPDVVLVRNLGALHFLQDKGMRLVGDFSLNAANSLTASWLAQKGLSFITPSYDLNQVQLLDLLDNFPGARCEVTLHHYIPAFHMEHCVFAAFLSNGTSYRDCGRPCERHQVELVDPSGAHHPLKADAECRNTMFNGVPQSAAGLYQDLVERGVTRFRIEALFESPGLLRAKLEAYQGLLSGQVGAKEVFTRFGMLERYGVSEGQLFNIRGYKNRKKETGVEEQNLGSTP